MNSVDVDIELTQCDDQNNDKRRLVQVSEVFCGFPNHESYEMAANINDIETILCLSLQNKF